MTYTFHDTAQLAGLSVEVENAGEKIHFEVSGPNAETYAPLIKLYYDWFNRTGPITVHEGRNVYSLYLPPIPSGGDSRLLEGIFRDKLFGLKTPRAVTIAVTSACQCRCEHCSAEDYSCSIQELSQDEVRKIIAESLDLGLTNVTFTGGEPLLRRDLETLIACVPAERAVSKIFTNAALLDAERAVRLKRAGLQAIKISLDSPEPSEHDRARRRAGSFKEVARGVQCALDAGLLVGLSTYATNEAVREHRLGRMAALASEWGVHEISVFDLIPTGRLLGRDDLLMTEDARKGLLEEARSLARVHGGRPRIVTQSWTNSARGFAAYFGCLAGTYQYHISPSGDFTPCDFTPLCFGNVRSNSIRSLWKKLSEHPAYCEHQRECRMQSSTFRQKYVHPIPAAMALPVPIEMLDGENQVSHTGNLEQERRGCGFAGSC